MKKIVWTVLLFATLITANRAYAWRITGFEQHTASGCWQATLENHNSDGSWTTLTVTFCPGVGLNLKEGCQLLLNKIKSDLANLVSKGGCFLVKDPKSRSWLKVEAQHS